MPQLGGMLAQTRPADTNIAAVLEPTLDMEVQFVVCNTSGSAAAFDVYHRQNDEDPDEDNALWHGSTIAAASTYIAPDEFTIFLQKDDVLSVKSSVAEALTFTFYGRTASIAPGRPRL